MCWLISPGLNEQHREHAAREDVIVDDLALGMGMPHVDERAGRIEPAEVGRQRRGGPQEGAAAVPLAEVHILFRGKRHGERLAVVGWIFEKAHRIAWRVPIHIPTQPLAGPSEHGVGGLTRIGGNRKYQVGQVGDGGRRATLQQASVARHHPGVVGVMMERMRIAATSHHAHEQSLVWVHHREGVVGLRRQRLAPGDHHRVG